MKRCPKNCSPITYGNDKFCYNCGTKLVGKDKCSCGKELDMHDKFCPKCGKEV